MKMIKYGIISGASIVPRFVAGINESKNGQVVAIACRDLNKAKILAKELNIKNYYDDYNQIYTNKDIDVVYIPTINSLHYIQAKTALINNKHVIVEKPFVLNSKESIELFEIAKKKNLFIMEAQKSVFLPTSIKAKEIIESKILGEIKYIELKAGFPQRFDYNHWMYDIKSGGGALYGSATYTIELIKFLFNNPSLKIDGSYIKAPTGSDDLCNFQLIMNNKTLISSTIAMNVPLENQAVFYGTKGYLKIPNFWKSDSLSVTIDNKVTNYKFPFKSEFVYEINHINDCIINNYTESPIMTSQVTSSTIDLVTSLYNKWKL